MASVTAAVTTAAPPAGSTGDLAGAADKLKPTADSGRKRRGAPANNQNATRHGRYSLTMGELPRGCAHVRRLCAALRKQLEAAVVAKRGAVDLEAAALIQTCVRHERHAQLALKWLRENADLPVDKRLEISRDVATASDKRDRCIKLLDIKAEAANIWDEYFRQRPALPAPPATPQKPVDPNIVQASADAPAGQCGVQAQGGAS